jgi:hypothetical protein
MQGLARRSDPMVQGMDHQHGGKKKVGGPPLLIFWIIAARSDQLAHASN